VVIAELEGWFSRAVAPTRRVAVGELRLPADGAGEAAALLLGGLCARFGRNLDEDDLVELQRLIRDVELDRRIPQPRLRHRFQQDRIGLQRCTHRLVQDRGGWYHLDLDHHGGTPEQQVLAAVYAARSLRGPARRLAVDGLSRGLEWRGDLGPELLGHLRLGGPAGQLGPAAGYADPVAWAIAVLGLSNLEGRPSRTQVRNAFRLRLRAVHPDHGALSEGAAERISEIDAARRILLG
jgi:hypothetical protein